MRRALRKWAERAPLSDLIYVLRRSPEELRGHEAVLTEIALDRMPRHRQALRLRLIARLLLVDPARAKSAAGSLGAMTLSLPRHPRASVFRLAAFVPDRGDYRGYGESLIEGLNSGLETSPWGRAVVVDARFTGENEPVRAVMALDSARGAARARSWASC